MIRLTAVTEMEGRAPQAITHEFVDREIIIGREGDADFQIPLSTISRRHALIFETDQVYLIEDLGSTHGTVLNGRRLEPGEKKVLRNGDVLELTNAKVTCEIEVGEVVGIDPHEGTQAIAALAVQGILGQMGEAQSEGPYFRILTGTDEGARLVFDAVGTDWTLGRSKDCEFVLNDPNVSRRHAVVRKDWNGFVIEDLGSKNGVLVGDRRITRGRRLKDRDEIIIGPVKLLFIDPDAELMDALREVPGFDLGDSSLELLEEDASHVGAPDEFSSDESEEEDSSEEYVDEEDDGLPGDDPDTGLDLAIDDEPALISPQPPEEDFAEIDPSLLEVEAKGLDWLMLLGAAGLILVVVVFILALLPAS